MIARVMDQNTWTQFFVLPCVTVIWGQSTASIIASLIYKVG